ncbi:hypothetical protein F441_03529 [Phytophthora nicotianae CJ01A1]|nr:hypothetical protein F441_03529 [Phytophthora nicotianae CJ01A1]
MQVVVFRGEVLVMASEQAYDFIADMQNEAEKRVDEVCSGTMDHQRSANKAFQDGLLYQPEQKLA